MVVDRERDRDHTRAYLSPIEHKNLAPLWVVADSSQMTPLIQDM
jgi:hypothetical protein